jgi:hypothetical protein
MKICKNKNCRVNKEVQEFYNGNNECKNCVSNKAKTDRLDNPGQKALYQRVWRKSNASKQKAYSDKNNRRLESKFNNGKLGAFKRKINWDLTIEQYIIIVSNKKCHYCDGMLPEVGHGLDRKINTIGYIENNVVSCCEACNKIKSIFLTYEEMVAVATLLKQIRMKKSV